MKTLIHTCVAIGALLAGGGARALAASARRKARAAHGTETVMITKA